MQYFWETVPVEDKRMQQLARSHRHQQPTSPPPRLPLEPPILFQRLVCEFQRSRGHVYSNRDPQLVPGIDPQREPCQTGAERWGKWGGERA